MELQRSLGTKVKLTLEIEPKRHRASTPPPLAWYTTTRSS
jgi:hypothetical protein